MVVCDQEADWGCACMAVCLAQAGSTLTTCSQSCSAYEWPSNGALVGLSQCWKSLQVDIACPCNLYLTEPVG